MRICEHQSNIYYHLMLWQNWQYLLMSDADIVPSRQAWALKSRSDSKKRLQFSPSLSEAVSQGRAGT